MRSFEAVFTNGVLKPVEPVSLREQERVRVTVESVQANGAARDAAVQRMIDGFDKMRLRTGGRMPSRDELHERR